MKAKNGHITYESYARTTLIDVKIAIFLSYIKCYFQWNSPVKWHTVIVRSYSLISNYVLYSVANIIFISRFKCVVHHFKLFAVEWRYSFAVEWRFTKPKSKKKLHVSRMFLLNIWYHVHVCFLMKTFYFRGLNQVGLSNLVFIVLNNIDGLKVDFCTKRYY